MGEIMLVRLLLSIGILAASPVAAASLQSDIRAWRQANEKEIVGRLEALATIPSVAADKAGLDRTADMLGSERRRRGFEVRLLEAAPGAPKAVFGRLDTPGARRTVTFYAHYDGQPVTPSQWASDPFKPVMRKGALADGGAAIAWREAKGALDPDWRLFARGASDDKASIVAFLAGFDALRASGRKPKVNLRIFWEGEEEAGSPNLAPLLARETQLLKSDLWLIGDGPVHQSRRPTLYFGARGVAGLEATIYGPLRPLHDGHYGNWVPNPIAMAATLLAAMRDEEGRILIPGVADAVRPLSPAEQAALAALPPVEAALRDQFAIGRSEGREGLTASTMRPALNLRGIRAGAVGDEAANAIPSEARFSIDFRLVPDQQPEAIRRAVERFLRGRGWTIVEAMPDEATRRAHERLIRLRWESGYPALRTDIGLPVSRAVAATMERAAGRPLVLLPMIGGSVPLHLIDAALDVPIIGLPIANHDNNQHAANENLRLGNLWDGVESYAALIGDLDW